MKQPQTALQKQMSRLIKKWEESGLPLKNGIKICRSSTLLSSNTKIKKGKLCITT
jgi:hypothetical protein